MNAQANQTNSQMSVEQRMRTMRTLWIAMLLSVGVYFVFAMVRGRPADAAPNNTFFLVLVGVSLATTLISFVIKGVLLNRAVQQQQVQMVQQAYIVAWALSEVAALLGVIDFFATGDRYYYVMFLISVGAQLLHFPRRDHILNASFKSSM